MLGASGAAADAEVIVLAAEALQAAGLQKFAISLGHVDFINGLAEEAGFDAAQLQQLKVACAVMMLWYAADGRCDGKYPSGNQAAFCRFPLPAGWHRTFGQGCCNSN